MADYFLLTPEYKWLLDELLQQRRATKTRSPRYEEQDVIPAIGPETYVARTPTGGIPALVEAAGEAVPGKAVCDIYEIIHNYSDNPSRLTRLQDMEQSVYNVSAEAVAGDLLLPVTRLKGGNWVVLSGGALSSQAGILARIDAVGTFAMSGTGSGAAVYYYDWVEISKDPVTGIPFDIEGGRVGTYEEGTFAFELTDALVDVGTLVHIFQLANGVYWFESGHSEVEPVLSDITCADGVISKVYKDWTFISGRLKVVET